MFPGPPVRSVRMTTISQSSTLVRFLAVSSSSRLRLSSNQHRLGDALLTSSIFHWTAHLHFRHWSEETVKLKKGLKVKLPLPTPGSQVTPPRHAPHPCRPTGFAWVVCSAISHSLTAQFLTISAVLMLAGYCETQGKTILVRMWRGFSKTVIYFFLCRKKILKHF